jgi:D-tyrosyl-tRNA(Tyr) deacylase/MAF protein
MRALLQRVSRASVTVDGETLGSVGLGLLVLAGVRRGDSPADGEWIAEKIVGLRIFPDEGGRMNRSVVEAGGGVLLVSQFTLYADSRKGRRPSFEKAAAPDEAVPLLDVLERRLRDAGVAVATGRFGAHMHVDLVNDGPVTILLDSEDRGRAPGSAGGPPAGARQGIVGPESPLRHVPIVLASASPRRRALLEELGLRFDVEPTDVDEEADLPGDAREQAQVLAERKARAAAAKRKDALVVAADTIVVLGERVYGKPRSAGEATRMLTELSGREHVVHTGVCVGAPGGRRFHGRVVSTRVTFVTLGAEEIRRYVATGEPMDKAGAYAIQGRGALLVEGIQGDWSNVVGLPVGATIDLMEEALRVGQAAGG